LDFLETQTVRHYSSRFRGKKCRKTQKNREERIRVGEREKRALKDRREIESEKR
jgi:hypothetical protein